MSYKPTSTIKRTLFTIALGLTATSSAWAAVKAKHFADGGLFDQIMVNRQ